MSFFLPAESKQADECVRALSHLSCGAPLHGSLELQAVHYWVRRSKTDSQCPRNVPVVPAQTGHKEAKMSISTPTNLTPSFVSLGHSLRGPSHRSWPGSGCLCVHAVIFSHSSDIERELSFSGTTVVVFLRGDAKEQYGCTQVLCWIRPCLHISLRKSNAGQWHGSLSHFLSA